MEAVDIMILSIHKLQTYIHSFFTMPFWTLVLQLFGQTEKEEQELRSVIVSLKYMAMALYFCKKKKKSDKNTPSLSSKLRLFHLLLLFPM